MKKLTLFVNDDCVCVSVTAYTKKKDLDNIDEEQVKAVKLLKNWRYK